MKRIQDIVDAQLCSGCGLCAAIAGPAAQMEIEDGGYARPKVNGPIDDATFARIDTVCPGTGLSHETTGADPDYHDVWGPVVASRTGWSSDAALRFQASSGGGLSAVLVHLIESGQADYVLQTAVSDNDPLRNALAISTGRDDIFHAAGSRYAPSSPLQDVIDRLDAPGRFVFVGKPCDVAALRTLARSDARVDDKVVTMLAFMCAGVPGQSGTQAVLDAMGVTDKDTVVAFRYRGGGWPGFATAKLADGTERKMDYNSSWGNILNRHLQFRCKICADGTGEFADITFADGWHCDENGYPDFEEQDGRSLILTRTAKGEALLNAAQTAGKLITEPLELKEVDAMQPFQLRRKALVRSRLLAMATLGRKRPAYSGFRLDRVSRLMGAKMNIKSYLGTLRRLVR